MKKWSPSTLSTPCLSRQVTGLNAGDFLASTATPLRSISMPGEPMCKRSLTSRWTHIEPTKSNIMDYIAIHQMNLYNKGCTCHIP